jgi:pimeloyl-ACP methyl ester carboxylesterase
MSIPNSPARMPFADTWSRWCGPPERTASLGRFLGATDNRRTREVEPELRRLSAPTLSAWGTDDVFFDLKWAHRLRVLIPAARKVVEIEGGRLFFPEERPDALADALREHWS